MHSMAMRFRDGLGMRLGMSPQVTVGLARLIELGRPASVCSPYYEWLLQTDFGKLTGDYPHGNYYNYK